MNNKKDISIIEPVKGTDLNKLVKGEVKIWQTDNKTGKSELILDKKNTVLYSGATILSYAISGKPGYNLNTFYVAYCNDGSPSPAISLANTLPFNALDPSKFGYLRLPLSFSPSFVSNTNYLNNVSIYTCQVTTGSAVYGPAFTSGTSGIYGLALVAAPSSTDSAQDIYFSRINFTPITYNSSFSLTISWGLSLQVS